MEETEANLQRMLLLVDSAHRAGQSEGEIAKMVDEAIEADAELEDAA
jgi:hypothetical protein